GGHGPGRGRPGGRRRHARRRVGRGRNQLPGLRPGAAGVRVIAIDGPAGAGKSTVAAALAQRLGLARLDTGAMYRAVAFAALRDGIDPGDGLRLGALARALNLDVGERVMVDGMDATAAIRGPEVPAVVSAVSV